MGLPLNRTGIVLRIAGGGTIGSGCGMTIIGHRIRFDGRACGHTCGSFDRFVTTGPSIRGVITGTRRTKCGLLSETSLCDSRRNVNNIENAGRTLE